MPKKKLKIIKEKIHTEFQEIKKEMKEEHLEEEVQENEDFESTNDLSVSSRTAPVLQSDSNSNQTIEEQVRNTPTPNATAATQVSYEKSVYNMPEYTYDKEAAPATKQLKQTGFFIRPDQTREVKPHVEMEDWHEVRGMDRRQGYPDEAVTRVQRLDREESMPFEQKKYKPRNLQ